jgi:hypothetical protein
VLYYGCFPTATSRGLKLVREGGGGLEGGRVGRKSPRKDFRVSNHCYPPFPPPHPCTVYALRCVIKIHGSSQHSSSGDAGQTHVINRGPSLAAQKHRHLR